MNEPTITRIELAALPNAEELIDTALMLSSELEEPDSFQCISGFNVAAHMVGDRDLSIALILKPNEGQPLSSNFVLFVFIRNLIHKAIVTTKLYEINNVNLVELKSILLKSNMFTVAPQTIH